MIWYPRNNGSTGFLVHSGSSSPFHAPRPGWFLNRLMSCRNCASRCGAVTVAFSRKNGRQCIPYRAAASMYFCSRSSVAGLHCPPVRRKVAPAPANSAMPFFPAGVFPSGGGGVVNPIGKIFFPSITRTWSELITALFASNVWQVRRTRKQQTRFKGQMIADRNPTSQSLVNSVVTIRENKVNPQFQPPPHAVRRGNRSSSSKPDVCRSVKAPTRTVLIAAHTVSPAH